MGFRVVNGKDSDIIPMGSDGASVYYIGQIVSYSAASAAKMAGAVLPLAVPAGVADTTNLQVVAGVVVGFNNKTPLYDSTYGQTATGVITQAAQLARDSILNGGMYVKGDPQLILMVQPILPHSIIEGPIFNNAQGTAPTVVEDTAGTDTTGYTTAGTTGACDFTPVADNCTIYCRKGLNKGQYRTTNDTSTTAPDVTIAFPNDVALGDQFVRVPMKQGLSSIYISGPGMYVNASKTPATHTFQVIVTKLSLEEAGKETVQFRFTNPHFDFARA